MMNPGLKRIEATLDQLSTQSGTPNLPAPTEASSRAAKTRKKSAQLPAPESRTRLVEPFPLPEKSAEPMPAAPPPAPSAPPNPPPTPRPAAKGKRSPAKAKAKAQQVKPFPAQQGASMPQPKSKPPSISSHRHATNPNLAMGLLKEIEGIVSGWQQELEQVIRQIQALYAEGPIVDGWLESQAYEPQFAFQAIGAGTLRHAEIEHLMEYIEQICQTQPAQAPTADGEHHTGYRLCGLDADGQMWSRPCPPPQVPYVGLAIARYQRLRVLLSQKQELENRLQNLVQTLTLLHGQMQ